jgi:hypothetical protein
VVHFEHKGKRNTIVSVIMPAAEAAS